jgi:hypothetical protein
MFSNLSRIIAVTLFVLSLSILALGSVFGSTEVYWKRKTEACYGDLAMMLEEVAKADVIPRYRTNRSAEELHEVLIKADRFRDLGLTNEEGKVLVNAVYEKLGINPTKQFTSRSFGGKTLPEQLVVPPYRAGTEFEQLAAVLTRWPFDWASQRDEWAAMVDGMSGANVIVYIWVNNTSQRDQAISYLNS